MINYFSKIEITGKIIKHSTDEDYDKPYYYLRLMFKDQGSGMKFVNVYCWNSRDQAVGLENGDIINVSGELAMFEKDGVAVHSVRAEQISLVERGVQELPETEEVVAGKGERLSF
jgi:RPA family protein